MNAWLVLAVDSDPGNLIRSSKVDVVHVES
jgi:hypothetical protein